MTITDLRTPDPEQHPKGRASWWRRWLHRFKRTEPSYDEVTGTDVVRYATTLEQEWDRKLKTEKEEVWAWVEKHALRLPDARYIKIRARNALPKLPGILFRFAFIKAPIGVWTEVVQPVGRGASRCMVAYQRWVTAAHLTAAQQAAEGPLKARIHKDQHNSTGYRVIGSGIFAFTCVGGLVYLYYAYAAYFWAFLIALTCVLDLIGRTGTEKKIEFIPVHREPINETMSYRELTSIVQAAFNEIIGIDANSHPLVRMDGMIHQDFDRQEYRQAVSTYETIKDEHIDALERHLGTGLRSVKILEVPAAANRRIVVIKRGDPLASVPPPPDYEPLSLTITHPLTIGVSIASVPFALTFAGVHIAITAATGGAKTKVHIRNMINALSACHDVWLAGIDLQNGPELSMWKGVIQRKAFTTEEADELLDFLSTEMYRRMKVLNVIADTDDESNDDNDDEWRPELGPYVVLFIDEFPILAEENGKSGRLDLLGKVKAMHRLGRKVGMSVIRAAQATGVQDGGTTVLHKQTAINIVGPCALADTDSIFTPEVRKTGYTPHYLVPADPLGNINDAGKCYIKAGGFGPDEYRGFAPLSTAEVKRRARRRTEAGLPQLTGGSKDVLEGQVVPNTLHALAAAMDEIDPPDGKLPSTMAAEWITENGTEEIDATELAKRLRAELGDKAPKAKSMRNKLRGNCSCYTTSDINVALEAL